MERAPQEEQSRGAVASKAQDRNPEAQSEPIRGSFPLDESPFIALQRRQLERMFGPALQSRKVLQRMEMEEPGGPGRKGEGEYQVSPEGGRANTAMSPAGRPGRTPTSASSLGNTSAAR